MIQEVSVDIVAVEHHLAGARHPGPANVEVSNAHTCRKAFARASMLAKGTSVILGATHVPKDPGYLTAMDVQSRNRSNRCSRNPLLSAKVHPVLP